MSYNHLTASQREKIVKGQSYGMSISEIALLIGVHRSTIYRELRRNSTRGEYSCITAQKLYDKRHLKCRMQKKLVSDSILYDRVTDHLEEYWSPEQIVGRCVVDVSVPTIYRAIHSGIIPPRIKKNCLRCHGKPYRRGIKETRGKLSGTTSIDTRSAEESARKRLGDIEGDTVLGRQGTGAVLTLVDRCSRYLMGNLLKGKNAPVMAEAVIDALSCVPCLSLTLDNGKEFAEFNKMGETLGIPIYFAHPHSPWERGTNENTNKLLRQFLPKGSSFAKVTPQELQRYISLLNNRPRKCLGFATPKEIFLKEKCRT